MTATLLSHLNDAQIQIVFGYKLVNIHMRPDASRASGIENVQNRAHSVLVFVNGIVLR